MTRKKLYRKYILYSLLYTVLAVVVTAIFEKVLAKDPVEAVEATGGGDNPIGTILGVFGSILFLMTFVVGIPSVNSWFRKKHDLSRKVVLQLHCDLATTATISIMLHVLFVSMLPDYKEIITWNSLWDYNYEGWTEWGSDALALTVGSWALFFMIIATVAGYAKGWIYRNWGRTIFIVIQNLTIISLINLTLHQLNIGKMTSSNPIVLALTIGAGVFLTALWLIYNYQMIKIKSAKKKKKASRAQAVAS